MQILINNKMAKKLVNRQVDMVNMMLIKKVKYKCWLKTFFEPRMSGLKDENEHLFNVAWSIRIGRDTLNF